MMQFHLAFSFIPGFKSTHEMEPFFASVAKHHLITTIYKTVGAVYSKD